LEHLTNDPPITITEHRCWISGVKGGYRI